MNTFKEIYFGLYGEILKYLTSDQKLSMFCLSFFILSLLMALAVKKFGLIVLCSLLSMLILAFQFYVEYDAPIYIHFAPQVISILGIGYLIKQYGDDKNLTISALIACSVTMFSTPIKMYLVQEIDYNVIVLSIIFSLVLNTLFLYGSATVWGKLTQSNN